MGSTNTKSSKPDAAMVAVPRRWLIAVPVLLIVPWIVAAAAWTFRSASAPVPPPALASATDGLSTKTASGPWGKLTVTPLVVSPPLEYVSTDLDSTEAPVWRLPATDAAALTRFLNASGLARDDVERIAATARPDPSIQGIVVAPAPDLLRRLDVQVRARLYVTLGRTPVNVKQAHSFRFLGASPEAWFRGSLISEQTRQLVMPLIYQNEGFLHFADLDLVRPELDEDELRKLLKTLHRHSTRIVKLSVEDPSEVGALAEYWGRGGRRTDIRPLLESIVNGGPDRSIDIVHLLPAFARDHLYRYPKLTGADLSRPVIANCLWTSLNFFSSRADDRFLDVPHALKTLTTEYYIIEHGFQLGDVVAFLDREGDIFHAAVYLADDLVFSKNGTSPMAPWTIMSIDEVSGYYDTRVSEPQLVFHRRKDL